MAEAEPKVCAIIPARLESSRLPRKVLADIVGLPMLAHVCHRTRLAKRIHEVYVATDSDEIETVISRRGFGVLRTSGKHATGTDRIAEAAARLAYDVIVNVQGDEALVDPGHIDAIIEGLLADPSVEVAFGVTPFFEKNRTAVIKAVLDWKNDVLYLSRADIPSEARTPAAPLLKVCHIVPFRKKLLAEYASWERTPLEIIEYNEYLRILEKGRRIRAVAVDQASVSVDTPEDLEFVRKKMPSDLYFPRYRR